MMLLPCPSCGLRAESEFAFGGEPAIRPVPAAEVPAATWAQYLYHRTNAKGPGRELWCHAGGCGAWFVITRDSTTHEVLP